jgi:PAS domain S-box-containing protein
MLVIFGFLLVTGRKHEIYKQRGWHFIVTGFGLLLLGSLLDITDNFESLNRYVVIGDTPAEAVLEKVVGYLLGFALLFVGFWYWLPLVGALRAAERRLETYSEDLKAKVAERTVELESANEELQAEITERKRVEEALRLTQFAIDHAGDAAFWLDRDGRLIYVNDAACNMLGYSREELLALGVGDIDPDVSPGDFPRALERIKTSDSSTFEARYRTKAGAIVPVEVSIHYLEYGDREFVASYARDITERKRAEEELERLSRQNELILNSAGEGIYGLDLEGRTTFINPAAARMIGWEPEELIGQPQHDILHHTRPDGSPYPREECPIYAAFKDGTAHHVTDEIFWRQDGTSFPVEYVSTPIFEDGKPVGAVVVFRDITEQVAQRMEIERVASDLSQLIDTANAPILGVDNRGLINEWNQMAAKIVGYSKKEALACSLVDKFIGDDDKAAVKEVLDKAIAGHETANFEFTLYSKSGERVEMLLNATPRRDSAGNIVGVIGVGQDITERKRAEGALRESEARAQAIVNTAADAIITIDERGIIERFNPASERLFGYTADAAIGRNVNILMPSPYRDEHDSYLARYLSTGEKKIIGIGREVIGKRKDGTTFPIELAVGEVRLGDRRIFTGIIRDITERKRIEQMKNEFISIVSHELRTPLTSILGSLGLIKGGVLGELPEQAKEMIEIAHKNSERLVRLINDMLDIEKIEAGKMEFKIRPLELIPLIEQTIQASRAYGEEFGVEFAVEHALPGVKVCADGDRLIQVVTNLLSNAAKFSPRGDTVEVSVSRHDGAIRVAVADHGPGIAEEFREHVFEKFVQADSSDAREKGGTGLGLSICKAIVEKLGGRIGFDTETGAGTTFYFDLPEWREAEAGDIAETKAGDIAETKAGDRPRVLICEDDRDIASLLRMMLDRGGYESDIAYTAGQAQQMLARQSYVAMTLDLLLPDRNGISLVRELRAHENMRSFPIIVVSIVAEDTKKAVDGGTLEIIDWLDKPIDQTRLLAVINTAVRKGSTDRPRILHIEDDADVLRVVSSLLSDRAEVSQAATLREARKMLRRQHFDLVLLDLVMPDGSGTELLPLINKRTPPIPVVVFSAYEVDGATAKMVAAILTKSRTSNEQLLDAIMAVIENG